VESSCEFGIEPSGSTKCWETSSVLTTRDLSSSAQFHRFSYLFPYYILIDEDYQFNISTEIIAV
jgi:hypothetical protein